MQRRWVQFALMAILVVMATAVRVYQLKDVPAGLYCDEAAEGYNAYAIGTTGYDENGKFLPLFIWSFGGYKNPIYIYTAGAIMRFAGINEATTRMPAALFGIGGIIALFFLGRSLFGPWVGFFAAALLAAAPWHLHFSRIAFDMTLFGMLFTLCVYFLVEFTKGRRTLPAALFFGGLCVYAYAIATLFVPVFLIGFGLLYLPTMLRRWKETFLAIIVALATVAPCGIFYYRNAQGSIYLQRTTMIDPAASLQQNAAHYLANYKEFFNPVFLFQNGDSISRHAVRGFGELLPSYMPLILLGVLAVFLKRDRASKLLLWWLLLYPAGASMMTEIPTATRSFIGAPVMCLLGGIGLGTALWCLKVLRWRPLVVTLQAAGVAAFVYFAAPEFDRYVRFYFNEYPKYSAPTYGGFQYGYRDSFAFMEPLRHKYDLMMITATEVNQPQIFALFYNAMDPIKYNKDRDIGYLISDPAFYADYHLNQRVLYQLRPADMAFFSDYTVLKDIVAPGGQKEFVIAEVRKRKNYLTKWMGLGLFLNDNDEGKKIDFIDPKKVTRDRYKGAWGDLYWRPIPQRNVRVDLNGFFATADPRHPMNPELVCAYTATSVKSTKQQAVWLELAGGGDLAQLWLNGESLTAWALTVGVAPVRKEITLSAGTNLLLVKSCETIGDWYFTARITDAEGKDIDDIVVEQEIPATVATAIVPPAKPSELQAIEGFDSIVRFKHTQNPYSDYRGGTESWWTYVWDPEGEVVWTSAPPPIAKRTVAVLTASISPEPFGGELYVNGKYALTFDLGPERGTKTFTNGAYRLTFAFKGEAGGFSGILFIEVPASDVTPGQPLEFRVVPGKGTDHAWFMVKDYKDNLTHENITPDSIAGVGKGDWQAMAPPDGVEPQ